MIACYCLLLSCLASLSQCYTKHVHLKTKVQTDTPVIRIEDGLIRGTRNQTVDQHKTFYAFRGIPFAKPPVGDLRFRPPLPATPWNNILDATQDKSQCVQDSDPISGSENCLFINVYTPQLPRKGHNVPLPVMVWIYGGSFNYGNSSYVLYGPDYLLEQDVVVVLLNYRLGIFGFFHTGDLVVPGNNGLRDQVLALKWVQRNIAHFGGDPSKVVIFGESSGAASVAYLLQTNLTRGLFRGAIMESGTSLGLYALSRYTSPEALATLPDPITANSNQQLVNTLRGLDYRTLQDIANNLTALPLFSNDRNGILFAPVREPSHEGALFTQRSHEGLSQGQFHHIPMIIGYNSEEEDSEFALLWFRQYLTRNDFKTSDLAPIDMNIKSSSELQTVGDNIKSFYWGNSTIAAASNQSIIDFGSDDIFSRSIRETVALMSRCVPTYYYRFSYIGVLGGDINNPVQGVAHASELNYIFRKNPNATDHDRVIRSRIVKLWTNFAKYLNPTPTPDPFFSNTIWPTARQSTNDNLTYLDIGNELQVGVNPDDKSLRFWNNLYNSYGYPPYDTY